MYFVNIPATQQGVITILTRLWAAERVSSHEYRAHALAVVGPASKVLADELNEHADDEDKHAHRLQDLIGDLGGNIPTKVGDIPMMTFNQMDSRESDTTDGMVEQDLQGEEGAIAAYGEAVQLLKDTEWFDVAVILSRIQREEREHRRELLDILGKTGP